MRLLGAIFCLLLIGLGIYLLRMCSSRFMLLRRSRSLTPYLYAMGGILSLVLITLAVLGALLTVLGRLH